MKNYTPFCTVLLLFCAVLMLAQNSPVKVNSEKTIATTNEELLTVMVDVENTTDKTADLKLVTTSGKGLRTLNSSIPVKLHPGEKIFVPVKVFIEKTQPSGSSELAFSLTDATERTVARSVTELTIAPKHSLKILPNEPQVLIERIGDSLRISTQVYNSGNLPEEVDITATFPRGYNSDETQRKKVLLQPFTNREVVFSKVIDKDLLKLEIFTVNIDAKDENNNYFGNVTVMVQNALGNRRYIDPLNLNQYLQRRSPNRVAWSTSNPFSEFSATHNLDLQTEVNMGNTKAALNLSAIYWPSRDGEIMLQNAWLKLENGPFGLQIGNINTSDLEISAIGRGVELSYIPLISKKIHLTAGVLEKTYNLFDPFTDESMGYAAYAKSVYKINDEKAVNSELVMDTDPFQKGFIFKNGYEFNKDKDTYYSANIGYGYAISMADEEVAKSSLSIGFDYRKNWKKYIFTSSNYYGSGYYPGLKKGTTVFEQRLARNFEKVSLYAGYSLSSFNPRNIDPSFAYSNTSKRSRIETGSSFSIADVLSVNISALVAREDSQLFLSSAVGQTMVDFRSAVLKTALNYNTPNNKNRLSLVYSQGVSWYRDLTKPNSIQQLQANWYHGYFSFSANYQKGNFLLYEGSVNGILNSDSEKISTIASYRLPRLNKKLNMNFSAFGNYERLNGNSLSLSSNIDYKIFRTTQVFGNVNYNRYSRNQFSTANTYYQIGISQEVSTIGEEAVKYRNGVIKVFAFYDLDNDNVYDPASDSPAADVKVNINNTIFISGDDGRITYRKLPYGAYTVRSLDTKWYADEQKIELSQKEAFITIPMKKTSVVLGVIEYQQTTKTQYEVQEILAGIPILFKNQLGKTFTFYTNAKGEYTAYVPVGTYKVSVESSVLQKNVYIDDNLQSVTAEEGNVSTLNKFLLKVREKKVEIKRFGTSE